MYRSLATFRQTKNIVDKCFQKITKNLQIAKPKYLQPNAFKIRQISVICRQLRQYGNPTYYSDIK